MAVELKQDAVLQRQRDAQRVVADETIRGAFERLKAGYLKALADTLPAERDKRELGYMLYKAACDLWSSLERDARNAQARDLKEKAEIDAEAMRHG